MSINCQNVVGITGQIENREIEKNCKVDMSVTKTRRKELRVRWKQEFLLLF